MISESQSGLSQEVQANLNSVFRSNRDIVRVILYGSRAKGSFKPGSDIDLALEAPHLGLRDLLSLHVKIEDLLLPYKVDLSLIHLIDNPALLEHIDRVGLELFKR